MDKSRKAYLLELIQSMFKVYLNNPNYYVRQEDVLVDLFMEGEDDLSRFCSTLGIHPYQSDMTYGQLLKRLNIL